MYVIDIDECADGAGSILCRSVEHSEGCRNLIGAFECICSEGYQFDSNTEKCLGRYHTITFA